MKPNDQTTVHIANALLQSADLQALAKRASLDGIYVVKPDHYDDDDVETAKQYFAEELQDEINWDDVVSLILEICPELRQTMQLPAAA